MRIITAMIRIKRKDVLFYLAILVSFALVCLECYLSLDNAANVLLFITLFMIGITAIIFSEKKYFIVFPIIIMFFICGLREPIFTDDLQYARIFYSLKGDFFNIFKNQNEKGFLFLNYVISIFTDEYKIAQIIFIGISFIFLYKGIIRLQKIAHPSFIVMFYFFVLLFRFSGAGLIRIQMAVSIFIYAVSYLNSDIKRFILLIVIASFFHRSSLAALILLLPICFEKILRKRKYTTLVLMATTILIFLFLDSFISSLASFLGGKYSSYVNITNFSLSILSVFYLFCFIYVICINRFIDKENNSFYRLNIYMFFVAIIFDLFFTGKTAFGRINFYFLCSYPFLIGTIWNNSKEKFPKYTSVVLFLFYIIAYFGGGQLRDIYILDFFERYENILF